MRLFVAFLFDKDDLDLVGVYSSKKAAESAAHIEGCRTWDARANIWVKEVFLDYKRPLDKDESFCIANSKGHCT